jgi:hypothetical protein
MRRGVWHQFGDRSQKLALDHLQNGVGAGVVISPRDLSLDSAVRYAEEYHALGAHVLIDQQFYLPDTSVGRLDSYPTVQYRASISQLHQISDTELDGLAKALEHINRQVQSDGVLAPAVVYEAGRPEIARLNSRLFSGARAVGDLLGLPVYATVVLGQSTTATETTLSQALASATSLPADGWYFAFEFDDERIPSSQGAVQRCCGAGLTLACTGKPLFHAYAGPLGLLSHGFGAAACGLGHSQNLWRFDRGRWETPDVQGGGGDAPARYFSSALWGTIVHPDETAQIPRQLLAQVMTPSPYTSPWNRWGANKHVVHVIGSTVQTMSAVDDARANAHTAIAILRQAVHLHGVIGAAGIVLRDGTNSYQANWVDAVEDLLQTRTDDFDYLALLK